MIELMFSSSPVACIKVKLLFAFTQIKLKTLQRQHIIM